MAVQGIHTWLRGFWAMGALLVCTQSMAQNAFNGLRHLFTTPKGYTAMYTGMAPVIDGQLQDAAWQLAPWSDDFEDIEGALKPAPLLRTRVKMLWNDSCLFIAAQLDEPHVWATLRKHDDIIYHDNDFEVFIDPDNDAHQYFEIELNAFNTVFDLLMNKPYRNGAQAFIPFDVAHLRTAVAVYGTLNNPHDTDSGWTVEMAIPFRSLSYGNSWKPPADGATWRINFSRVQWDTEIKDGKYIKQQNEQGRPLPEHNWVWSPQGVIDMHLPERWGYLVFSRQSPQKPFEVPYSEKQRQYLWLVYYRQREHHRRHTRFAKTLRPLGIPRKIMIDGRENTLNIVASSVQFTATITDGSGGSIINDDGLIKTKKMKP